MSWVRHWDKLSPHNLAAQLFSTFHGLLPCNELTAPQGPPEENLPFHPPCQPTFSIIAEPPLSACPSLCPAVTLNHLLPHELHVSRGAQVGLGGRSPPSLLLSHGLCNKIHGTYIYSPGYLSISAPRDVWASPGSSSASQPSQVVSRPYHETRHTSSAALIHAFGLLQQTQR